ENMAQAVFETLSLFGLKGQVLAIMADNASNNDMMCEELQKLCEQEDISFNARWAQLQCLPHTTHLSALVLLEGIGTIKASKTTKNHDAYQDCVTAPLTREHDNDVAGQEDQPEDESKSGENLHQLRKIVRAVRSSPQCHQAWLREVNLSMKLDDTLPQTALMLILDIKTRWSSTHQMLCMLSYFHTHFI
ncbi:hypothetical protein EDB19DRAFT_1639695, partial [Suillus lakei]